MFMLALRSMDVLAVALAGLAAYVYKFGHISPNPHYSRAMIIAGLVTFAIFPMLGIYRSVRVQRLSSHIASIVQALMIVFMVLAGLAFITKLGETYSREWFGWWFVFALILGSTFRAAILLALHLMRSYGLNERRVIIIGAGSSGRQLVKAVQASDWTGFRIISLFDDSPAEMPTDIHGIPVQKTPDDINQYLTNQQGHIDEVWLALPLSAEKRVREILYQSRFHTVDTRLVLDILGLDLVNHSITDFAGLPILNLRATPMVGVSRLLKACEDRLLASVILLLISPLLLVIALAVKLSSAGPVFYRQKRVGWNGVEFDMLKFRTMPVNAEAGTGPVWAKKEEARATRVGAFLRKTSLDELPQFINVLKGDMSIVGPRPERQFFVEQFKEEIPRYMQKHIVKAGITGWAQINGWRGNTDLQKRIEYDLFYIENWSLWFDIKIILLTFLRGFVNKNAY